MHHNHTHDQPHDDQQAQDRREAQNVQPDAPHHAGAISSGAPHAHGTPGFGRWGRSGSPPVRRHPQAEGDADDAIHLLFGSLEDLLADLEGSGPPDGNIVRVERLVRSRSHTAGGTATLGVAVTARRTDEILSVWVIVARLSLDPWGQPLSPAEARAASVRHHDAWRMLAAFVADAGFAVRGGLYLLVEGCYGLNASAAALAPGMSRGQPAETEDNGHERGESHA